VLHMSHVIRKAVSQIFDLSCCAMCPTKHACITLCMICTEHNAESRNKVTARSASALVFRWMSVQKSNCIDDEVGPFDVKLLLGATQVKPKLPLPTMF